MSETDDRLQQMLKAMADPTRFKILNMLQERHYCARALAIELGITEAAVSQHLGTLKRAGLVSGWRHGRHMHYQVNEEAVAFLLGAFELWGKRMAAVQSCEEPNSCNFRLDDGSNGCLYSEF